MNRLRKSLTLLVILGGASSNLVGQDICGFFVADFYYVDSRILIDKNVTEIKFEAKGKDSRLGKRILYLDGFGNKIKEKYSNKERTYELTFDKGKICQFACPSEMIEGVICNNNGFLTSSDDGGLFHTYVYDDKGRLYLESWKPIQNFEIKRRFVYNTQNQLDSALVLNYENSKLTGDEIYKYVMQDGKLQAVIHYLKMGADYMMIGECEYKYNESGLIIEYIFHERTTIMRTSITYYSKGKKVE